MVVLKKSKIGTDPKGSDPYNPPLDMSKLIEGVESKPIIVAPKPFDSTSDPLSTSAQGRPNLPAQRYDVPVEERLKEDLKISYQAKGILDITFGGYGFLRQNYVLSPDHDIYVSTSQIRRFWLRRGDEVEGLARPAKAGERFHSLLLIKKINGIEMTEEQSAKRKDFEKLTALHPNKQMKMETTKDILSTRIIDLISPIGFGQRALIV
ncbi:MAG: transcription termination factor Rho, partial [Patescibacteria group bacterium]